MVSNLVIVESPAKAGIIQKILGKDFVVRSCYGHVRDLRKKELGISIEENFKPLYQFLPDKINVIKELKDYSDKVKTVWLAADDDREGEAIAWHLSKCLKLNANKTKRIVFHEITPQAINHAIQNPTTINMDMVNSQQARRVLDRLVGFKLSPLLWKHISNKLSAGRVQSVAVKLIMEKEKEIDKFSKESYFAIQGIFSELDPKSSTEIKAVLDKNFDKYDKCNKFLEDCKKANFVVESVKTKSGSTNPPLPYTTSTLQQDAFNRLGYSSKSTMYHAQKLYEKGKITYMRTDSTKLSTSSVKIFKDYIEDKYGAEYIAQDGTKKSDKKSKHAQEAHEAIRPTDVFDYGKIKGEEEKLYNLIWRRAVASIMSPMKYDTTQTLINISNRSEKFKISVKKITFEGFSKVYKPDADNSDIIKNNLNAGDKLTYVEINCREKLTNSPARFNDGSIVKAMEKMGIGRPSTYASIISTIQDRGYVIKKSTEGSPYDFKSLTLKKNKIKEELIRENIGAENNKLFSTDMGKVVTDFLQKNFETIMDYDFTANVEESLDQIAQGNVIWNKLVGSVYKSFSPVIDELSKSTVNKEINKYERLLGTDGKSKLHIYSLISRYGPVVRLGEKGDQNSKFASIPSYLSQQNITLSQALTLLKYPVNLGKYKNNVVRLNKSRYGYYLQYKSDNISIPKDIQDMASNLTLDEAIDLINDRSKLEQNKITFDYEGKEIIVLVGKFGPYFNYDGKNYGLPKDTNIKNITLKECVDIIKNPPVKKKYFKKK